jgi:hypothetical protein
VLVYAFDVLDGWALRALVVGGLASLIIAEKRSPWLEARPASTTPADATRSSPPTRERASAEPATPAREAPERGLGHRVLVYLGLREDAELSAEWERFRPDTPAMAIGFALGVGAIATILAGVISVVRLGIGLA